MEVKKTGFLRNFTWKNFGLYAIWIFLFTLLVGIVVNYIDPSDSIKNLFTPKELIQRLVSSFLMGFVFATWTQPKNTERKL